MTLKHFIERPVLASVISIVIVIAGIIGLATLPIEQYPDIAPPTVMVRASYPGASAETIQKSVIVPLEQAINGVEDMTYMTSSAAVGSASVTVNFRQGINADRENIAATLAFAQTLRPRQVNLLPYHATGRSKYARLGRSGETGEQHRPPPPDRLEEIRRQFAAAGFDAHIGG